ncbi:hypothetical protein FLONG3_9536 [Fusarium longipes]|uniref:Uncharacterized protein n=1 Tax=Fusarium longipes TaxID=694270 RepID=A0A395RWG0_9HYPO|nr:hypothetical protein FLONG3_9536 [Fusarium longipes]
MDHDTRLEWFLNKANLNLPPRLTRLSAPANQDFLPLDSPNLDIANSLLVQARVCSPDYKPPETQMRHHFRTKSQKAAVCDVFNWTFTKHEVAKAFDALLDQPKLPPAGVAQALLKRGRLSSIDELWAHLHDEFLERKMKGKRLSSESIDLDSSAMTWLDKIVAHQNINYVHLICQTKVNQTILDRALGIALSKPSLSATKLLLSFGAVASNHLDIINIHIQAGNVDLIELLLSAPGSMDVDAWKKCLDQDITRAEGGTNLSISLLLLIISNRPQIISDILLLKVLKLRNLQAVVIVMAYSSSNSLFFNVRHQACELASQEPDDNKRLVVFTLLSRCDLVDDNPLVREELFKSVKQRHIPLVKFFVRNGVKVDEWPYNSLQWAITQLDSDLIDLLKRGNVSCFSA